MLDLTVILISISPRFRSYFDKVLFGLPRLIRWARKKRFISEVVVILEILVVISLMVWFCSRIETLSVGNR